MSIGREEGNDLTLMLQEVSASHAVLTWEPAQCAWTLVRPPPKPYPVVPTHPAPTIAIARFPTQMCMDAH